MNAKHTNTPYRTEKQKGNEWYFGHGYQVVVLDKDGEDVCVAGAGSDEILEHIVHCVNVHDELVEALTLTVQKLHQHYNDDDILELSNAIEVLSKAKGE